MGYVKNVIAKPELLDICLAQAIKHIGKPLFPQSFMQFIQHCMAFDNFIVIAYEGTQRPNVLFRHSQSAIVYAAMDTEYVTGSYLLDPFYDSHIQGIRSGLHRLFEIAPDRFKQTSYFNLYYQKTTLIDEVAAFAETKNGGTLTACITTDKTSGRSFSKKEIDNLKKYSTVICTLMERHWANYDVKYHDENKPAELASGSIVEQIRGRLKQSRKISLSPRQAEVAILILQGHSSRSISLILEISLNTVKIFRRQLYSKCNISSQAELFAMLMSELP